MQEVTLAQMLDAREARAQAQQLLLEQYARPIACFTMNIPGPVKDSPLIRRGFEAGWNTLRHRLPKGKVLDARRREAVTGCEALLAVDMDSVELKKICTAIEDETPLGRLFDMDVLDSHGVKLDRGPVGGKPRNCIVCGASGRGCASRRTHTVPELQNAARRILTEHFAQEDARYVAALAVKGLLDEVLTTPKPGLVDRHNSGSHRDMDIFTFSASASALAPYFQECAQIGQETRDAAPEETFRLLRAAGLRAEEVMLRATRGVNTHKGAVFTMGLLCGAAGRLWRPEGVWQEEALFREVSAMTARAMEEDLRRGGDTAGQRLYASRGVQGIRGEVSRGLPSVRQVGLPVFRECLSEGMDRNDGGAVTLLHLIARVEDTNLLSRGGPEGAREAREKASALLERSPRPSRGEIETLDDWFISRNLSPGGCADLLAAVYFLQDLFGNRLPA